MAQLVEQRIRNAWVGSSSLPIGRFCILTRVNKGDENSTKRRFCQSSSANEQSAEVFSYSMREHTKRKTEDTFNAKEQDSLPIGKFCRLTKMKLRVF